MTDTKTTPKEYSQLICTLRDLARAYPADVFPDFTEDERREHAAVITRASGGMGRHLSKFMTHAADAISDLETRLSETQSWRSMETAPKNATWVALLTDADGRLMRYVAHFAEGGGEDQPAFGPWWFYDTGYMYDAVRGKPVGWAPLPEAPKEGTK